MQRALRLDPFKVVIVISIFYWKIRWKQENALAPPTNPKAKIVDNTSRIHLFHFCKRSVNKLQSSRRRDVFQIFVLALAGMEKRNKYLHSVYTYACHGRTSRIKMHFQFPKNNCGVTAGFGRNVNLDTSNWAEIHYPVKLHPRVYYYARNTL